MNGENTASAATVELLGESAQGTDATSPLPETSGTQAENAAAPSSPADDGANKPAENAADSNQPEKTVENQPAKTEENKKNEEELAKAWENLGKNLDVPVNEGLLSSFVKSAKEMGLDPEKSQKLIDWQVDWFKQASAEILEKSTETLKKEWGDNFQPNLNKSLEFVALINSKFPNNEFANSIKSYGICNDANFIKAMHMIAQSINEDSLAKSSGALSSTENDPLEGIHNSMREKGIKI